MSNQKPRIAIGMPVYNGEKYIESAISSILAQTFIDFHFIISDNASTDRTQEICLSYAAKDSRIHYYRNETNFGAAPNYNRVFHLSSNEFFKWADYDDLLAPEFLSKCIEVMDRDPDIVVCFPSARVIDENGAVLGDHQYKSDTSSPDARIRFQNLALYPDMAYQVSGLMRSALIKKTTLHGSYPSSDLVLLAELSLYGRFYEIPEPLFFPRYHSAQSTKGALSVERSRVVFFDTSNAGKILLPKWMLLFGFLRAIWNGPVDLGAKMYCYLQMVRWVLRPAHFRALGKDILLAIQKIVLHPFSSFHRKK
jgi:glycosyltransferase involved in cell wall biosynthesis